MKRVFGLWFLKSMTPLLVIELIAVIIAIYFFANLIFVSRVVDNAFNAALGNPVLFIGYLWDAFWGTRTEVQAIIIILFLGFGMLLRDINRSIISYILMRRSELLGR